MEETPTDSKPKPKRPARKSNGAAVHPFTRNGHALEPSLASRGFGHDVQFLVGRVRIGWAITVTLLSIIAVPITMLAREGWVEAPAKERDVRVIQTTVTTHTDALKALVESVHKLEIGSEGHVALLTAQAKQLDSVDRKIDRLIEMRSITRDREPEPEHRARRRISHKTE